MKNPLNLNFGFIGHSYLITGGTGSLGKGIVQRLTQANSTVRIVVFSRGEEKQQQMAQEYPQSVYPNVHFVIGDICNLDSLQIACKYYDVDIIIHAAAMKHVDVCERNPSECLRVNIDGTLNVVKAAKQVGVKRIVGISTDKATAPSSAYGYSKGMAEKILLQSNGNGLLVSAIRYGNVFGSSGSVIPRFLKDKGKGELGITDINMSRFSITLDEAVDVVIFTAKNALGGEVLIPKLPSYRITDVATAVGPQCRQKR
ncbi:MAG: SDR family NAD(P)-dependent oxidoreductase [Saprospiraceae bacterium]|nr:SDR family NAD(P)-dependent oxidoreductase [Saprospiraceae bacterium]